jgi:hypothetical protein
MGEAGGDNNELFGTPMFLAFFCLSLGTLGPMSPYGWEEEKAKGCAN